jgi:hypothetical protein
MSAISKQALVVDNSQSFPNNNAGAITPTALRNFNTNMIDSNVNQTEYNTNSGSWNVSISNLNTFTASQQPSFTALNSFTASQLTINTGYNSATQSLSSSIATTNTALNQVIAYTGSVNQIVSANVLQGYSTRFYFDGLLTASVVANVGGAIATISLLTDTTKVSTASFNAYTQSTNSSISNLNQFTASTLISLNCINQTTASLNAFTASANTSINQLLSFSSSLDATYATDTQLNASASTLQANIDTKLNTSSFNAYTQSINSTINSINNNTGSYATTGSNSFSGSQTITGSVYGNVVPLNVSLYTASMDLSKGNFFTLQLSASQNIRLEASNIKPGQTINLRLNQATASVGTISFPTYFDFPAANIASASAVTGAVDILSFLTFDTNTIYSTIIKNLS